MKRAMFFPLLLSVMPLVAQQPAPTQTSAAAAATNSAEVEPEQSIRLLRANIAAARREMKANLEFTKESEKAWEAQIRVEIARKRVAIVNRKEESRVSHLAIFKGTK